jgi:hypothetical protein
MRFRKAVEALSRDGSLAVFGQVPVGLPAPLLDQFKEIYLRQIGKWGPPPEAWYLPNGPFKGWFIASGLFEPVEPGATSGNGRTRRQAMWIFYGRSRTTG